MSPCNNWGGGCSGPGELPARRSRERVPGVAAPAPRGLLGPDKELGAGRGRGDTGRGLPRCARGGRLGSRAGLFRWLGRAERASGKGWD